MVATTGNRLRNAEDYRDVVVEDQNLWNEIEGKEGLEVYGRLNEGVGFKEYLHGPNG